MKTSHVEPKPIALEDKRTGGVSFNRTLDETVAAFAATRTDLDLNVTAVTAKSRSASTSSMPSWTAGRSRTMNAPK
jgi:hypothetical protein